MVYAKMLRKPGVIKIGSKEKMYMWLPSKRGVGFGIETADERVALDNLSEKGQAAQEPE